MTEDNALRDHLRELIDAQGPNGYVMSYALEAALKAYPETDDGAGTPPAAVAAAGETATPTSSPPTCGLDRAALMDLFELHGVFETMFVSTERMESGRRILADAVLATAVDLRAVRSQALRDAAVAIREERGASSWICDWLATRAIREMGAGDE